MNDNAYRYAVYYLPSADTRLYSVGTSWLGYDIERDETLAPPENGLRTEFWQRVTESPRRYRFHATLKPPFRLAEGTTEAQLRSAVQDFAGRYRRVCGPALQLARLGKFSALILSQPFPQLEALAADCVREFDSFRMPPESAEFGQRSKGRLSERELENIRDWGYPYVFDEWKFHMTLTSSISDEDWATVRPHLEAHAALLQDEALRVDSVCLFSESAPNRPFRLIERYQFSS